MLKLGLTGGAGCGKSLAAFYFRECGAPIIDADIIAHQLTAKGSAELDQIVAVFGEHILKHDGNLNRQRMRTLIFDDDAWRQKLDAILHPAVRKRISQKLENMQAPYCVVVIPLLFEAGMQDIVDYAIVVDCPTDMQVQRIVARDHCSKAEAQKIIASQCDRKKRLEAADIIIDNTQGEEHLGETIRNIHARFLSGCN